MQLWRRNRSRFGALLVDRFAAYREPILFFTLCMFLLGSMLYIPLITLIFYRFTFVNVSSISLTPPYWINMGAVAITLRTRLCSATSYLS